MTEKKMPTANATQRERFAAAARAVGADESEAAFQDKLAVIARQRLAAEPRQAKKPPTGKKGK